MTTTAPPTWLSVEPANLPHELTGVPSWYPGLITPRKNKPGKWNKMPADPQTAELAKWKNPATRRTFSDAYMAYQRDPRFKCIGYMMHGTGIVGIDLDDAIAEDDSIKPWAQEIVDSFAGAYWERSISGTGLRGFCRGVLPEGIGGCKRLLDGCSAELYCDVRYLAVTGHALGTVDILPTLQDAVDALYARLSAGRARATGTAVRTGLVGRVTDLTPDELAILEAVMGGRWSATMAEIWSRDELDASGASEEDWALEKEAAYWAIRRGLDGDELALTVERIMRAGPYRSKWDEARGTVSWLAQDVANAIQTTQDRLKKTETSGPTADDDEAASEAPATPETPAQTIARLERENRQLRATNAVQMTVINGDRAAREAAESGKRAADELVVALFDVIAIDDETMNARTKLVALVLAREAASRNSRGIFELSNAALAQRTGLQKTRIPERPILMTNEVSQIMLDLAARAGTPFDRWTTRTAVEIAPGITEPRSIAMVRITTPDQSTISVIRALPSIGGPSDKEMQRKAKAKTRAAAAAEAKIAAEVGKRIGWGWCSAHENADVIIRGHCSACGEVVGERPMTADEFKILNPEIQDSASQPPLPVDGVNSFPPEIQDSEPPRSLLDYVAIRPQEAPTASREVSGLHCGTIKPNGRECVATLYRDLGGGCIRCLGCGARTVLAAMGAET